MENITHLMGFTEEETKEIVQPKITLTIPWENEDKTIKKVLEVHINNLMDAIKISANNYESLEGLRQFFIMATMKVEELQGNIKYGQKKDW